ncbi:unnamed protein product [Meganyctiphanes norvegica]|uniref:SET domain-containing protein n=1 Tax=Meganyctiphanes norvegica TaxID=48144 RepID=A0AAV2PQ82_MEGNR
MPEMDTDSVTKITNLQNYMKKLKTDTSDGTANVNDSNASVMGEDQQKMSTDSSDPIVISESPTMGRRVLAARDILPGEVILRDSSLFPLVPSQGKGVSCLGCLKSLPEEDFPYCTNCGAPLCDAQCDGRLHTELECTALAKAGLLILTDKELKAPLLKELKEALMVLRILHDLLQNPTKIHLLWALESNVHKRKLIPGSIDKEKQLVRFICDKLCVPVDEDLALHISGAYDTNSFNVPASKLHNGTGCALLPAGSMINHSCLPNSEYFYADATFYVRSTVFIPANSEIFINYSRALWGTRARRGSLLQSKLFLCKCQRCTDPTELKSHISSVQCGKCPGLIVPSMRDAEPWRCNTCNGTLSTAKADTIVKAVGQYIVKVPAGNIERLREASDLVGQHLGPQHFVAVELRHRLVQALMKNKEELTVKDLYQVLDLTKGLLQLADLIMPGKTFFRGHMLLQKVNAAAEILLRNHKEQHKADQQSPHVDIISQMVSTPNDQIDCNETSKIKENQTIPNEGQFHTQFDIQKLLEETKESQDILSNELGQSLEAMLMIEFFRRLIKQEHLAQAS